MSDSELSASTDLLGPMLEVSGLLACIDDAYIQRGDWLPFVQAFADAVRAAERERRHQWSEDEAVAAAHAAGFAGTHWSMGPEELAHLLNMVHARPNAALRTLVEQPVNENAKG